MIFKPFKPGKYHAGLRQFPQSVQEIRPQQPLFQRNQRKLPHELQL